MQVPPVKTSKVKLVLAACGVVTLVAAVAGGVIAIVSGEPAHVSELALHPEQQDEILAQREADALRAKLDLTEEQTKQVADLWLEYRKKAQASQSAPAGMEQMRGRMMARMQLSGKIRELLTPEQQAAYDETPDGKRQSMMQIMQNATPEERQAFFNEMRKQMPQGFGGGPPGGFPPGGGFPPPPPPNGN